MLQEKINKDYIAAMKQKEAQRAGALSFLRAQLKNFMIAQKTDELKDEDVISVIRKQVKQRQDSIAQFTSGGRPDLAAKEQGELEILRSYLPQELPVAEIQAIIHSAIQESGAQSIKDMGQVMKIVVSMVQGRADNKQVSQMVRETLTQM